MNACSHHLEAARTLRPRIRAAADDFEQARRLPEWLVAAFLDAGLFRMYAPRSLAGPECHPVAVARVIAELAHGDASAAWCAMIASQCAWFAAFLPDDGAGEVFGDPRSVVGAQTRPEGEAVVVDDGYRVTGRWPFTSGLCGTGSHDVEVSDRFVPRRRAFAFPPVDPAGHAAPLYRDAIFNLVFVPQAGQALGVADAAIAEFVEIARSTRRQGQGAALREQSTVQTQVAEARAIVDAAWAYLERATNEVCEALAAARSPTLDQRIALRLAITHAILGAIRAGDIVHAATGGSAVYTSHPLNRRFRDLHAAGAHMQAAPRVYEVTGQVLLGLEPRPGPLLP